MDLQNTAICVICLLIIPLLSLFICKAAHSDLPTEVITVLPPGMLAGSTFSDLCKEIQELVSMTVMITTI